MLSSLDLINQISDKYGWTDYRIAQELGVSRQAISLHRTRNTAFFSDSIAIIVADLLELDRLTVIASMHYHREADPKTKKFWKGYGSAAVVVLCFSLIFTPQRVDANSFNGGLTSELGMYYAQLRRFLKRLICTLFAPNIGFQAVKVSEL